MAVRARWLVLAALAAGLLFGLAGCLAKLLTPVAEATLIVSEAVVASGRGQVTLAVRDMPDGGMALIAVNVGGMTYRGHISNVAIEGIGGFEVLASLLDDGLGAGGFVVSHASMGVVNGEFARITFDTTGPVVLGDIALEVAEISMLDDTNTLIAPFSLDQLAHRYYVK